MSELSTMLAQCRVMIADDDPFSRNIVARMLRTMGCGAIIEAVDGNAAFNALSDQVKPIDIAILDFRMPGYNGLKLLQEVRVGETLPNRHARIVMLTSSADYGLLGAAMALDVDAFLTKPIALDVMAPRLHKVIHQWSELKPPAKYAAVDIDAVVNRLMSDVSEAAIQRKNEPERVCKGLKTTLDDAAAGMVLAENIEGPNGELVLAQGIRLTERLLRRLVEVREILALNHLYVEAAAVTAE